VAGVSSCTQPAEPPAQSTAPAVTAETPPNVVFILADTLRADQMSRSRNGQPLMPNLTAFAEKSWNYERAWVQSTWTKPSMASMLTSLYPAVHNVLYSIDGELDGADLPQTNVLPTVLETMAEYLKSNGYSTGAVQSNANLVPHFGFAQGFDTYEVKRYPKFQAGAITEHATAALDAMTPPFFYYAHFMDTHAPYDAPASYIEQIGGLPELSDADKALLADYGTTYRDRVLFEAGLTAERKYGNLSQTGEAYIRAKYDACSRYLDDEVQRLITHIQTKYPNTIIVITSDHGEELWEHGSIGHGKTVYEELTHVPLIIHQPGAAAAKIGAPVETIDVLPTLSAMLNLPVRKEWQGQNIAALANALPEDRAIFSSTKMSMSGSNRDLEAVLKGQHKLIVDNKAGSNSVFDLNRDPGERESLTDAGPPTMELLQILEAHRAENAKHPLRQVNASTAGLTPEQEENIRALGYIE